MYRMKKQWTEKDLEIIINRIHRIKSIDDKIIEIFKIRGALPMPEDSSYLGAIRWWLSCKLRRLRIKKANELGTHTFQDELNLIKSVKGKCAYCGDCKNPTIDHIVPISKGGSNGVENIQVLCNKCNSSKRDKIK